MYIFIAIVFFLMNLVWTAGLGSWLIDYSMGLVQGSLWITLMALIPFSSLWVSGKTRNTAELTVQTYYNSLFSK